MEKIIYVLWRDPQMDTETFSARLRGELTAQLRALGVRGLQVNVSDAAVKPAAALRQKHTQPAMDAFLNVWVDSAIARLRKPLDEAIAAQVQKFAAYLVTESRPLRDTQHPPRAGERTEGFAQIALLKRPARLVYADWLDIWHNSHTDIAIETQASFEYVQNVVVRALSADAPVFDAIVEECFPAGAMTDYKVFFDAPGDEQKFRRNLQRMMESVSRFIEPGTLDVVPTSQYRMFWPGSSG
ncbi:MAG: EthD domain-containing protein [Stenotrophobium sp.]